MTNLKNVLVIFCVATLIAVAWFRKAPDDYNKSGIVKLTNGNYKGAEVDFSGAIQGAEDSVFYRNRSYVRRLQSNNTNALADLNRAVQLNSNNADAYYDRGFTELELGNFQASVSDLSKYIEQYPFNSEAYFARGLALQKIQKLDEAIADYDTGIRLNPKNPKIFLLRGCVKMKLRNFSGGITDFTSAIELQTNNALAYKARAYGYKAKGDLTGFTNDWNFYLQFNRTN